MKLQLPVDVYSPDQVGLLVQELRALLGKRRDLIAQARITGRADPFPSLSSTLETLLKTSTIIPDDLSSLEELIKQLEDLRVAAPMVHLTLAAMPNRTLIRQLTVWFRDQIHPNTLLTFVMRRDVGGGVIVRAGSSIYDFSFRGQILRHKDRISEIFASV